MQGNMRIRFHSQLFYRLNLAIALPLHILKMLHYSCSPMKMKQVVRRSYPPLHNEIPAPCFCFWYGKASFA